jgi:hypothetical protein
VDKNLRKMGRERHFLEALISLLKLEMCIRQEVERPDLILEDADGLFAMEVTQAFRRHIDDLGCGSRAKAEEGTRDRFLAQLVLGRE